MKAGLGFGVMFAPTSALLEEHPFLRALRQGVDVDAASSLLMILTVGYVEAPGETTGGKTGAVLEGMGRLLDRWLLDPDGDRALGPGDLLSILETVLRRGGQEEE